MNTRIQTSTMTISQLFSCTTTTYLAYVEAHVIANPWRLVAILEKVHNGHLGTGGRCVGDDAPLHALGGFDWALGRLARYDTLHVVLHKRLELHKAGRQVLDANGAQPIVGKTGTWVLDGGEFDFIADGNLAGLCSKQKYKQLRSVY